MKKIKILFIVAFGITFSGCLKDDPNVDFSTIGTIAEISSSSLVSDNSPTSGLDYFKKATLPSFSKDTGCDCYLPLEVTFNVNIASEYPPKSDVMVTLAVDDAKRVAYNAAGNLVKFDAAPDSIFTFATKTAIVKAGSRLAKFTVTFFPDKIDPSVSYLLPITIKDASGINISGNLGTIYLHNIGNPLAGTYNWLYRRWNAQDSTGEPTGGTFTDVTTFLPVSPTSFNVATGYYVQPNYLVTFTNTGGVFSNFKAVIDPKDLQTAFTDNGIAVVSGPTIIFVDPVNKIFEIQYTVFNGTAYRYVIDKFNK